MELSLELHLGQMNVVETVVLLNRAEWTRSRRIKVEDQRRKEWSWEELQINKESRAAAQAGLKTVEVTRCRFPHCHSRLRQAR